MAGRIRPLPFIAQSEPNLYTFFFRRASQGGVVTFVGSASKAAECAAIGSWERSLELDAKVIAVGKDEGISFDFGRIERTPNTLDAHRLIWLAEKQGVPDAVVEALFRAYFTERRDISNRQALINVVAEAGLDRKPKAVLESVEGMDAIKEAADLVRRFRVEGVPFFIVNGKITLSGAQQPDAFLEAFNHVVAKY